MPAVETKYALVHILGSFNKEGNSFLKGLAFGEFLQILEWVAKHKGKLVVYVDRWYPSSKTCSSCGHVLESLALNVRQWRCPSCGSVNSRDENAAKNIQAVGASTAGLGDVRQSQTAIAV